MKITEKINEISARIYQIYKESQDDTKSKALEIELNKLEAELSFLHGLVPLKLRVRAVFQVNVKSDQDRLEATGYLCNDANIIAFEKSVDRLRELNTECALEDGGGRQLKALNENK